MRSLPFTSLDLRKQVILKAVVNDYVRTAEPVGSRALMSRYELGVRSATIRNEMAELSELGYLHQPHTSAGRVPSDRGYRFYVDRLMDETSLPSTETSAVRDKLAPHRAELDIILEQTCRILSDLCRYTSIATDPAVRDAVVSHVSVAKVSRDRLLLVVVLDNGEVLHEMLEPSAAAGKLDVDKASNYLSRKLTGRTLRALSESGVESAPVEADELRRLLRRSLEFFKQEAEGSDDTGIHFGGTSYIMQQPEFKDIERLEAVLSVLEQRGALYKLLSSVYLGPSVTVIIGAENPVDQMRSCSFVAAKYKIAGRVAGTIGIVGPTRMDYRRAVGAVDYMARNLSGLLTELSVA